MFLPPHRPTEQVSLNKWPLSPPCARAEISHWRDLQTEEAKINKEEDTVLEEVQAGIKISRRNINKLRYADDTTLMAESEEELKILLMKVKVESEKFA